ncbi:3-hydroxybutyrate dehydrogenase [Ferruginivarius sediminum]|uniref:3-hydroxybutyrate dehydrogenase n=1 Tax=Ferruginivarius sediminum TaxID=2661937 RepID=A0A369TC93_9PROT|nr:3-hydroxybutyrate dehydrogenase [Ferruginivarius sediminum]RDD61787.1 3-hydroxybutyrate dehydrogenase [Ferruginivarius sediminum]
MLKGKTALVTGSTSGIGQGIAERLAAEGCNIVLNGFGDADEIETLRQGIADANGVEVAYSAADMSKPDEIRDMIREAEGRFGAIDILVNNAGIQHVAPVDEFPPEKWEQIIAINLSHVFYTTHHALPKMRERGWGRIINIASAHGLVASAGKAGYVAAKHGVIGLTKTTALDTAGTGITCNAICPGWVKTPLVVKQIEAKARDKGIAIEQAERELLAEKQPALEFVTPEQLGAYAAFLCSDAARTVTGAQVQIDGGWTAQ